MDEIDKIIVDTLLREGELSTYKISKKTKLSWSAVNLHCHRLEAYDKLTKERRVEGWKKITFWRLKDKNEEHV